MNKTLAYAVLAAVCMAAMATAPLLAEDVLWLISVEDAAELRLNEEQWEQAGCPGRRRFPPRSS